VSVRHVAYAVALVVVTAHLSGDSLAMQASSARLVIVISDLHMGPGRDPATNQWHPIEDFRWREEFEAFLRAIDTAGKGATDLVLNGDTFDLWQSATGECRGGEAHLGCNEEEALARLERVLTGHASEIAALGAFARSGANRIVLVPGEHDAALLMPQVARRIQAALDSPGRADVAARGYWISADGRVYAEHGHQLPGDPYRLASWPTPFVDAAGARRLERSRGEQLVASIYNEWESQFPIVDNVAQDGAGVKYLAAADANAISADRIAPLLSFFMARPSWQQFRLELDGGDVQPPEWDLEAARRAGLAFFAESLLPDDRFRPVVERAISDGRLTADARTMNDRELAAVCDFRAALRRSRRRLERSMTQARTVGPVLSECVRLPATRGSAYDYFWRSRDELFGTHLESVRRSLPLDGRADAVRVFVHGHTHLPAVGFVPARNVEWPIVLNAGAWQRTVTPFQLERVLEERGWSAGQLLRELRVEDLPGCYGVVWIEPYTRDPRPRLRFWRTDGTWGTLPRDAAGMATACGGGGGPSA
jgi:UDP-2,3-diacylglucosamine pyrophosphatase LpxH